MRVLVLNQNLGSDEVEQLSKIFEGDEVHLLTGSEPKEQPNITIHKTAPHDPRSLKSRFICWIKYRKDVRKFMKQNKNMQFDLVYATSNPPINSLLGVWCKKKTKSKFVFMNWDIYPHVVEKSTGNPVVHLICKGWHFLNNRTFPKIDKIVTLGEVMAKSINKPLKKKQDIAVIPYPCDPDFMKPIPKEENRFIKEQGLEGKFVVLYSGKLGLGHNIPLLLESANALEDKKDILFLFIGKGPGCDFVQAAIDNGAENVKLLPHQPEDVFQMSMASGDVGLVSQEDKMSELFMPSKTFNMMACGMPILAVCNKDNDLYNTVINNNAGVCPESLTAKDIASCVLDLYENKEKRLEMGKNARKATEEIYSKERVAEQFKQLFKDVKEGK
ncbi:MAG: glycosyltransferase family 4 protein [Clostridia bacterium]|nr:glycosyltransferase family 4 protein [Clostridia bacterium]